MFVLELLLCFLVFVSCHGSDDPPPNSVTLKVINAAGAPVSQESNYMYIYIYIYISVQLKTCVLSILYRLICFGKTHLNQVDIW